MSTWTTTSTNSPFGSTGVGPAIEGSSLPAPRSKPSQSAQHHQVIVRCYLAVAVTK